MKQEKETPTESSPETKPQENSVPEAAKPSESGDNTIQEENVPFHKHPRFKALIDERRETQEELKSLKEEMERIRLSSQSNQTTSSQIPDWFSEVWGLNEDAWQKYQKFSSAEKQQWKQEAIAEIKAEQQKLSEENSRWEGWIEEQLDTLKSEGKQFDRNEFLKVMVDYKPTNDQGLYDFEKGYDLYTKLKQVEEKPKSNARKEIASMTMSGTPSEPTKSNVMTPSQARKTSWLGLI